MQSMQCPICCKHLTDTLEANSQHVNMCIDERASSDAIQEIISSEPRTSIKVMPSTVSSCPICFRMENIDAIHIKKCGKSAGITTKKLIQMAENLKLPSNGTHIIQEDLITLLKSKPKRVYKTKAKETDESNQPIKKRCRKKQEDNCLFSSTLNHSLLKKIKNFQNINTPLTTTPEEERQTLINEHIKSILNSMQIVQNQITNSSSYVLPTLWKLSSLTNENFSYIVEGFEPFCQKIEIEAEFKTTPIFVINDQDSLRTNMANLVDQKDFSDIILKVSNDEEVYAHSFIWKANHLIDLKTDIVPVVIECQQFSKKFILTFLNYCYTGSLEINHENKNDLYKIAKEFGCNLLLNRMRRHLGSA